MKMAQAVAHTDDCSGCFWFVLISLVSFFYSRRRIKADGADDSVSLHDDAGYDGGGIIKGALSPSQIEEYLSRGVLVVPGVLSPEEVQAARRGFHASLANHGVDVHDLQQTASNLSKLSSTNGSGGILDMFYDDWKLKVNENRAILAIMQSLWAHSYCSEIPWFRHCFEIFCPQKALMYIDRVCFRLPERIGKQLGKKKRGQIQRSLTPHLDCCPQDVVSSLSSGEAPTNLSKWRPIQAFVALTDTTDPNEGGFEACPGLHKRFLRWEQYRLPSHTKPSYPPPCVGSFTPIRPVEDRDIIRLIEHIPCRAGDLVCWDYRIPHSNARFNNKKEAREVLYLGFLPYINLNKAYAKIQLQNYLLGKNPTDQWIHTPTSQKSTDIKKGQNFYQFSAIGRMLMGIDDWVLE